MDLILGGFVRLHLETFSRADIDELESIMDIPDQEMLGWATKLVPVPAATVSPLLARILDFTP